MAMFDGLLGSSWDDPKTTGLLALAANLSSGQRFMPALAQGLLGRQQIISQGEEAASRRQMRDFQMQEMQEAMAQRARQQEFIKNIPSPQMLASQTAMSGGGGPTVANAARMPQVSPELQMMHGALQAGFISPMDYIAAQKPKAPEYKVVGNNLLQTGPEGVKEVYSGEPKMTSAIQEYEYARKQGYPGTFEQFTLQNKRAGASNTSVSYLAPIAGIDASGRPVFFQPSKDGGAPAIVPGVAPPKTEKQLTDGQAKSAAYASQMFAAEEELGTVKGFDMTNPLRQAEVAMAKGPANFAVSQDAQRVRQAQEQWSEAYLRFKTGAAATSDEVRKNVQTFFPQPGDKPEVVAQKKRSRALAAQDVVLGAGGAKIPGVANPTAAAPQANPLGIDPSAIEAELRRRQGR